MKAPIPKTEARRLKVLWQYDVLDTLPEEMFDDLTELAATICDAPIALISLVDEDRQWFKSRVGMSQRETSRDISFCAHAILQEDLFVVSDATQDVRFKNNPMVTGPDHIRFYAGAPLITPDGHGLGTLCVLDKKPRQLRSDQRKALSVLARHVMTQLELRRRMRELRTERRRGLETKAQLTRTEAEMARLRARLARAKPSRNGARARRPGAR